jgi:hypothetical protein
VANRYPEAALIAARQGGSGPADPGARWEKALLQLYPGSPTSRKKGGPRGAFLGLCEEGLVKGIPAGNYSASKDNKAYAVQAAALLAEGTRSWSTTALWQAVTGDPEKKHSSQMDIVLALWKNGFILSKS